MKKTVPLACLLTALLPLAGCDKIKDVPILTRIVAKNVCDGIFISGQDNDATSKDVAGFAPPLKNSWQINVDTAAARVTVRNQWFTFFPQQTAELADSDLQHGCQLRFADIATPTPVPLPVPGIGYSFAEDLQKYAGLQAYVESVAAKEDAAHTTALLVIHKDTIVGETYRDGLTSTAPIKGFSMSKSIANLLVGRKVDQHKLDTSQPMAIAVWQNDTRAAISWNNSLQMSSGLGWNEAAIGKNNDQTQMLYAATDPSRYALEKPAIAVAGTKFNYSSGDFMNIATALVDEFPDWFDPGWDLGGHFSMEFTPDGHYPLLPEGVALPLRGWAQAISLYTHAGKLGETQILSPAWVKYSLTPSSTNADYGAGIWLNLGKSLFPQLPADSIAFIGAYDRYAVAIPSLDLIVVRMGYSEQPGDFDMQQFIQNVAALLKNSV